MGFTGCLRTTGSANYVYSNSSSRMNALLSSTAFSAVQLSVLPGAAQLPSGQLLAERVLCLDQVIDGSQNLLVFISRREPSAA